MQRYNPMTKCLETVKTNDYLGTLPIDKKKPPKFKNIEEIYKKCKAEGRSFKNNERDWFKKALDYADKKAYKPEERRKLNDWYKQIVRQNFKDNKTVDANNADLLLKRLSKDANKIQGIVSEIIRRKEWGNIDERGVKNLNKMIVMAESTIDELANISYRALSLPK